MTQGDPGSFRDPASRVLVAADSVVRILSDRGLADWTAVAATDFVTRVLTDGRLIATDPTDAPDGEAGALRHPLVSPITYPYEWTFSMLRDAALLQLDLLAEGLDEGVIFKDATPYNIQFVNGRPTFIDAGSLVPYVPGEPWVGYRQFCQQFLFPLMLRAWVGVPFQPWLRGNPEGLTAGQIKRLIPARHRLRLGAILHVELQARAEARLQGEAVRGSLSEAGFSADMIKTNIVRLRGLVESLSWSTPEGDWAEYSTCDHVGRDRGAKSEFLTAAMDRVGPRTVLDLGANDGHFSLLAVRHGAVAIAVDGDEEVLDALYSSLSPGTPLSVVLADLSNPPPAQGWAGVERPALFDRVHPDLVVAYGLIHHLLYSASVPPRLIVEWLAGFGVPIVVEFVAPDDPMVQRLSANKTTAELHDNRDLAAFRELIAERFSVVDTRDLDGGTRVLFELDPR